MNLKRITSLLLAALLCLTLLPVMTAPAEAESAPLALGAYSNG